MTEKKLEWKPVNYFYDRLNAKVELVDGDNREEAEFQEEKIGMPAFLEEMKNVVVTPLGILNVSDELHPLRDPHFYQGTANFNLTSKNIEDINNVDGVEYLRPFSRYRFIVGICSMFNPQKVKEDIEAELDVMNINITPALSNIIKKIRSENESDDWVAYIFPNGKHILKKFKVEKELEDAITLFSELQDLSGGITIS